MERINNTDNTNTLNEIFSGKYPHSLLQHTRGLLLKELATLDEGGKAEFCHHQTRIIHPSSRLTRKSPHTTSRHTSRGRFHAFCDVSRPSPVVQQATPVSFSSAAQQPAPYTAACKAQERHAQKRDLPLLDAHRNVSNINVILMAVDTYTSAE